MTKNVSAAKTTTVDLPPTDGTDDEALEYVYCGRRWSVSGSLLISVRPIKDGKLQREMIFAFERKTIRAVGGVYSGASFYANGAKGLSGDNTYERLWHAFQSR